MAWKEIKLNLIIRKKFHFEAIDLIRIGMIFLFILSYALKFFTIMTVIYNFQKLKRPHFWLAIRNLNSNDLDSQKQYFETFYWLNAGNLIYFKIELNQNLVELWFKLSKKKILKCNR